VNCPFSDAALLPDNNVAQFNIFNLLRTGTADIHKLIERRVPVFCDGFNLEDYTQLVEYFFGFWAPVEERLSSLTTLRDRDLALQSRLKCPLLREDLLFLGRDPVTVRHCKELPVLDTFLRGLGCLYVLEGSTLGSQIIAPRLAEHLQLREGSGASFFNAYGSFVRPRWIQFKRFVSASVTPEQGTEVVAAAGQTFLCFYEWLGTMSGSATRR
jgi:heme oxygenase